MRDVRQAPNRQGSTDQITSDYADYRDVNGVKFPFSFTQTQPNQVLTVKFDEIKTNIELAADLFQNPTKKFAGEAYEVTLYTIPHQIYKENDGIWDPGANESFYFKVVAKEKHSRPITPASASLKFYSGQDLVKSLDFSQNALSAIRASTLGGFANQEEVFDLNHYFSEPVRSKIDRIVYKMDLKTEEGSAITKELTIPVETYQQKTKLIFPLKGKFLIGGAHDFNEPHADEWSQHYAYDIVGLGNQYEFSKNNGKTNADYFTWGREILAPANGTVMYARNDVPENPNPGEIDNKIFMSRPDPMRAVGGNNVVIDHGNGEYSFLAHMQQGSVRVKQGDHVKQGDVIGLLGNTGNSDGPHLHYHLMACETVFRCDGLPSHFENIYDAWSGELFKAPFIKRGLFLEAK
jgi:murein DD-endopeptidase MepM/ murein hydrolase activator NlpD